MFRVFLLVLVCTSMSAWALYSFSNSTAFKEEIRRDARVLEIVASQSGWLAPQDLRVGIIEDLLSSAGVDAPSIGFYQNRDVLVVMRPVELPRISDSAGRGRGYLIVLVEGGSLSENGEGWFDGFTANADAVFDARSGVFVRSSFPASNDLGRQIPMDPGVAAAIEEGSRQFNEQRARRARALRALEQAAQDQGYRLTPEGGY